MKLKAKINKKFYKEAVQDRQERIQDKLDNSYEILVNSAPEVAVELLKIIKTELIAIKERLQDRNIEISFTKSVENYILNKIKLEKNHARQIKSAVKVLIQVPISNYIVKNRGIDKISINVVDKSLQFA